LRTVVWAALDPSLKNLVARWSAQLTPRASATPLAVDLHGTIVDGGQGPLFAVAAAAAEKAAGRTAPAQQDLAVADRIAAGFPTYYGSAWDALGRLLLTTDRLADPST
jgi:endoglucanase